MWSFLPRELDPTMIHATQERGDEDDGWHRVAVTANKLGPLVVRLFCSGSGADTNPFRDFVHLIPPRGRAILAFSPSQVCQNFIYLVNFKTMPCVIKPWRYNLIKLLHFKTYSRNIKISLPLNQIPQNMAQCSEGLVFQGAWSVGCGAESYSVAVVWICSVCCLDSMVLPVV